MVANLVYHPSREPGRSARDRPRRARARRRLRQRQRRDRGGAARLGQHGRLPTSSRRCWSAAASARRPSGWRSSSSRPTPRTCPSRTRSFDVAMSIFGAMFAPDQQQTAAELLRVVKPGGRIGMANWIPDGGVGDDVHDDRQARAARRRDSTRRCSGAPRSACASCSATAISDLRVERRRPRASRSARPTTTSSSSAPTSARSRRPSSGSAPRASRRWSDDLRAFLESGEHGAGDAGAGARSRVPAGRRHPRLGRRSPRLALACRARPLPRHVRGGPRRRRIISTRVDRGAARCEHDREGRRAVSELAAPFSPHASTVPSARSASPWVVPTATWVTSTAPSTWTGASTQQPSAASAPLPPSPSWPCRSKPQPSTVPLAASARELSANRAPRTRTRATGNLAARFNRLVQLRARDASWVGNLHPVRSSCPVRSIPWRSQPPSAAARSAERSRAAPTAGRRPGSRRRSAGRRRRRGRRPGRPGRAGVGDRHRGERQKERYDHSHAAGSYPARATRVSLRKAATASAASAGAAASAAARTRRLPTMTPSAIRPTSAACAGVPIPKPTATGVPRVGLGRRRPDRPARPAPRPARRSSRRVETT